MYFTDTHVQIMSKGLLEPGEQLVSRSVLVEAPWYTFGMWIFHKTFLVLATDQRLIMVEHSRDFFNRGMKTDKIHSVPWNQVSEMKVKGLFMKKSLRIVAQSNMRLFKGKMKIPNAFFGMLAPIKGNMQSARVLEQQWNSIRQLGAPPSQQPQLQQYQAPQAYGSMAPQLPQGYAPQQAQASHAPQAAGVSPSNVPPPSIQQQQQAWAMQQQQQQLYAQQQQNGYPQQGGPGPYYPQA